VEATGQEWRQRKSPSFGSLLTKNAYSESIDTDRLQGTKSSEKAQAQVDLLTISHDTVVGCCFEGVSAAGTSEESVHREGVESE
jgi:hypothetical protein